MQKYKAELLNQGYTIVPNLLPKEFISKLRTKYLSSFTKSSISTLPVSEFLSQADISDIVFSDTVIKTIETIVGTRYCMYPDFTMRQSLYIPWHTDTPYLTISETDDFEQSNMVQMSIYLQDNTLENGGGLEVIPASHRQKKIDRQNLLNNKIDFTSLGIMPSTAGSLVFWDSRLLHKSREQTVDNKQTKLAIQWTISKDEQFSDKFLQFLMDRINSKRKHVIDEQRSRENDYLHSICQINFPNSFNEYQVSNIKKYGLKLKLFSN